MEVKKRPMRKGARNTLVIIAAVIILITIIIAIFGKPIEKTNTLNPEQKAEFTKIINKLQAGEVKNIARYTEKDKGNKYAYLIKLSDGNELVMYSTGNTIISVMLGDKYLYADGKYKAIYTDYVVSLSESADYQYVSKELIKKILKSPKSADFPNLDKWKISKENSKTIVQSYVDAENGFGASIRSEFQIIFGSNKEVTSLILDGKEYAK